MTKTKGTTRKSAPPVARPGFRFDLRLIALVLGLLTLAFFRDVALEGLTFVSPDANAPAGFARIGGEALRHGVYPLWNPYVFLGMPSFGSGAYNPWIYPPDWPLAWIAHVVPLPDQTWLLLYYFLGGLFTALLAMELGARAEGALLSGALFAFIPNMVAVGAYGHGSQLVDSAYLPLLVWLAARWMRRGGLQHLGFLALAGGFQMLRGHAQIAFYSWMAVGLYVLVELVRSVLPRAGSDPGPARTLARAAGVGLAMSLAFGIAGFYNLPLRDYARYSIRGGGADGGVGLAYATSWSLAPWEFGTTIIPNAVGFGGPTYFGGMPFTEYPNAFFGVVALVLLLPAFLTRGASRVYALVLGLFALMVSMGHFLPVYGFLYAHLPLFNKFRVPVMIILLFHLAVCLGLAWGWTRILEDRDPPGAATGFTRGALGRLLLAVAALLALVFAFGVLGQGAHHEGFVRGAMSHRPGYPREAADQVYPSYVADLGRAAVLGLLAVGLAMLARRRTLSATIATCIALALVLVDVWPISDSVMRPAIGQKELNSLEAGRDDLVDWFTQHPGLYRVLPLKEFVSNRFSGFGIQSLGGYHAAKPRIVQDLIDRHAMDSVPWMALLGARYVVYDQPLDMPGYLQVFQGREAFIFENTHAMPRATLVAQVRVAPMDTAVVDSIRRGTRDPREWVWLEKDPGALGPVSGGTATIRSYRLNDVTVDVDTPGPALLRLADLWYPDWTTTVDGHETPMLRADYALRAVRVPAGRHQVVFQFRSRAIRQGLILSLVSLTAALLMIVTGWLRRRRRPAPGAIAEAA
ncbi:MAG: hypothetical protein ACHQ52_00870 [Candidatus Eisenbacteria bacterium]